MSLPGWFSRIALLIPVLLASGADLRNCSEKRAATLGNPVWSHDGRGNWSASTTARETGTAALRCRIDFPYPSAAFTLAINHALATFIPSSDRAPGAGLTIDAAGTTIELLRVAGEDWIAVGPKSWLIHLPAPARRFELTLTLHDPSTRDPVRIDLSGLTVSAAGSAPDRRSR